NPGKELSVTFERDGQTETNQVIPKADDQEVGKLGVYQGFEKSFFKTFEYGFTKTYETTKLILTSLGMLITGQYSLDMLSGPVGIYSTTDQVVQTGFMNFLMWTAMLSINLGIVNL